MARTSKEEHFLIQGLGLLKDNSVEASFSHFKDEFRDWLVDVAKNTPPHQKWFSKCWDQVIFTVLVHGNLKFILAAYECVGRAHVRSTLLKLRDESNAALWAVSGLKPAQVEALQRKLEIIAVSMRGVVPPRKVLVLYEGAPKKFLTKEDQSPELLEGAGKSRLQKELEAFDKNEDDFVFSVDGAQKKGGGSAEDGEDDDDFTFTIPAKAPPPPQQQQQDGQPKPSGAVAFTSPHAQKIPANVPRPKPAARKVPSPGISTDFTWNGTRVSPDDNKAQQPKQQEPPLASPLAARIQSSLHSMSFRGKQIFSAQFEKNGGGRHQPPPETKVRGQVDSIAPSGLRWEDEIAAQLAAAGVRVSNTTTEEGNEEEEDDTLPSPMGASKSTRFVGVGAAGQSQVDWRSPSLVSRQQERERGLGLSRISKGFRRAFNRQSADDMGR